MKRYLLFTGSDFDNEGGWNDFRDDSGFIPLLIEKGEFANSIYEPGMAYDWYQIVDSELKAVIENGRCIIND